MLRHKQDDSDPDAPSEAERGAELDTVLRELDGETDADAEPDVLPAACGGPYPSLTPPPPYVWDESCEVGSAVPPDGAPSALEEGEQLSWKRR